jgi:hypothetical protein
MAESGFDKEFKRIMSGSGLGEAFDELFSGKRAKPKEDKPVPLPTIRGKVINGVAYVHAGDVAAAMEVGAPGPCARLIAKLRRFADS